MGEVFVSYSRSDAVPVESIATRLLQHGYDVWWDKRMRGGEDFSTSIESALAASKCAVVAWSTIARNSLWVKAEANYARESGKLVQLTLDGSKPPLPFSMLHTLDFSAGAGANESSTFSELVASIDAVISGAIGARSGVSHSELAPNSRLAGFGPVVAIGGASIGLVVLAASLVALGSSREFSADAFGVASGGMFLTAVLAFGHMLTRVIITFLATRR
jgi:hypothetical protein